MNPLDHINFTIISKEMLNYTTKSLILRIRAGNTKHMILCIHKVVMINQQQRILFLKIIINIFCYIKLVVPRYKEIFLIKELYSSHKF